MLEKTIFHSALKLVKIMDNVADENVSKELADIIKFHAKGATASSLASAIPGVGAAISGLASAGFIWSMYARINKLLGLKLSENILKTLATGVVTNLAGYAAVSFVAGTLLSFIPFGGTVLSVAIVGAAIYGVTMVSGVVYLNILTAIFSEGKNPNSFSADKLKSIASDAISELNVSALFDDAKEEFKEKNEAGEFDEAENDAAYENYDEAENDAEDDGENATSYYNRGVDYFNSEQYDKSIADFSQAIELDSQNADFYYCRGRAYYCLEQYDKAIVDFSQAIKLDSQNADFYYFRGLAYHCLEQYDNAIADFSKAIELNPQNADFYYFRGAAYAALKQYHKAIADFSKAIKLDSQNADFYYCRGAAYAALKQYDNTIADFSKTIELAPAAPEGYDGLIALYKELNQPELAAEIQALKDENCPAE